MDICANLFCMIFSPCLLFSQYNDITKMEKNQLHI